MAVGEGAPCCELGRVRMRAVRDVMRRDTHNACRTSSNLEVGRDEIESDFETGKEGG